MPANTDRLVWIDLEMTGLNPDEDRIIETATIITDIQLNILDQGPVIAIHQHDDVLARMDEWNTRTHNASGLVDRVRASTINEAEAERQTLDFVKTLVKKNSSPLCGNTICQDRRFLFRHMPKLESYLHYRNLDVSTLKELSDYWYPGLNTDLVKKSSHRALDDIIESIEELRFWRERLFKETDVR
ncbi:MAG: oligoribonuclease [marine bacterium B5-7]|nr:MAG: oligoribonuclease [marine bacterium B5-7]